MEPTSIVQDIERIVLAAQDPRSVYGTPVLVLSQGQSVADLTKFLKVPLRKKANPSFNVADSFVRYVNEHKTASSRIYVPSNLLLVAILDHNSPGPGDAGWAEHSASYAMQHSLEWQTWTKQNGTKLNQKDFCEFVEDNAKDFSDRTNMLELVRTLQVNSNVAFNSWEKGDGGNVALSFTKTVQARAGEKGEVELPTSFQINIPCFQGGVMLPITAKLRFDIAESDKKLKLWYELQKVQQMLIEHTKQVVVAVTKSTGIEPFFGTYA
jgi:uncharacterized protein YfdQ (DUF2303 family)